MAYISISILITFNVERFINISISVNKNISISVKINLLAD